MAAESLRKIEIGLSNPTDSSLARIALSLGLREDYFLQSDLNTKPVRQRLVIEIELPDNAKLPDSVIPHIRGISVAIVKHIALILKDLESGPEPNLNISDSDKNSRD